MECRGCFNGLLQSSDQPLIEEFSRLPGIGSKSAQRLAFHVINMPLDRVEGLANAIVDARKNVRYCKECCTLTDQDVCPICSNPDRDKKTIMVVETPRIWRRMKRLENIMEFIMFCMVLFLRCWELVRGISG